MANIKITEKLMGSLSELYYKEYCDQYGWAYISLEQIHENGIKKGVLKFLDLPAWELKEYEMYNSRKYPSMKEETRKFLKEYFKPYNDELYKFLGIDFGW